MAMDNITSNNNPNFYWWFGVVEDRNDPLRLGRCRVRIIGYHTEDNEVLPSDDLPWAIPVMPANSAGTSGVGWSPTGAVEGSWVVGFFADGENGQHPMFFGTVGAIPGGLASTDCAPSDGSGSSGDDATGATPGEATDGGAPIESGPPNQEFWTLVAICYAEAGPFGDPAQNQCDVAQSIYNRAIAKNKSILAVIFQKAQYQPVWYYPQRKLKEPPVSQRVPNNYWRNIKDANTAAAAVGGGATPAMMLQVAKNLKNKTLQDKAKAFVGARTDFLGGGQPFDAAAKNGSIVCRDTRGQSRDREVRKDAKANKFGFIDSPKSPKIAQVPPIVNNQALA